LYAYLLHNIIYRYIMFGRGICEENTSRETKNFPSRIFNYTEYYLEHWYNTFCLSFSGPNMIYLFNSTEWCYIKRTTDNVSQILLQASRWWVKTANTVWEGYLRKIPVLRLNFSRHWMWDIFRLLTGIFRKYSSQTWYICI
jgi:hypothetical protein